MYTFFSMKLRHYMPGVEAAENLVGKGIDFGIDKGKEVARGVTNIAIGGIKGGCRLALKAALFGVLALPIFAYRARSGGHAGKAGGLNPKV